MILRFAQLYSPAASDIALRPVIFASRVILRFASDIVLHAVSGANIISLLALARNIIVPKGQYHCAVGAISLYNFTFLCYNEP